MGTPAGEMPDATAISLIVRYGPPGTFTVAHEAEPRLLVLFVKHRA